jgi:MFS transporter, ACS family, hexuronate transporter
MSNRRSPGWQWQVSVLLLLATMINYMDRQTLANLAQRITEQYGLTDAQYGNMETVFGLAFAVGSLFFGILADRVSVRWLYPSILVAWSLVGVATGLSQGYWSMLICRGLLGFFEAGHWPCALIVTQSVMARSERVMGNSILQSGASLGAIVTPLIILSLVGSSVHADAWRVPFLVIGCVGLVWAVLWFWIIRPGDLSRPHTIADVEVEGAHAASSVRGGQVRSSGWLFNFLADRRVWALMLMVISINTSWQLIRAWLPKFLQAGRGYSEAHALLFNSVYFIATDVGCILAGVIALALVRRGLSVHSSRVLVYLGCAGLAALTTVAAVLPQGWMLLMVLLLVAAGTLGVFPCYYSFTQEVSTQHMGRLTGLLSFAGWLASSPMQTLFGMVVDRTGSYDFNLAILGWAPLVGLFGFWLLWPATTTAGPSTEPTPRSATA